jgi:hypothetical protein
LAVTEELRMTDGPKNLILTLLRSLDAKVDGLSAKLDAIATQVTGHTRVLNVVLQDVRLIRAAADDASALRVTSGEIAAMHEDINRDLLSATLEVRVEAIEGKP